jgi:hypothetical protein
VQSLVEELPGVGITVVGYFEGVCVGLAINADIYNTLVVVASSVNKDNLANIVYVNLILDVVSNLIGNTSIGALQAYSTSAIAAISRYLIFFIINRCFRIISYNGLVRV